MCSIQDLTVGRVFELYRDELSIPPKQKICVIVGFTSDGSEFGTVYINSGINYNYINSPELEAAVIPFNKSASRPFIRHDSYIDCSEIKSRFPSSFIRSVRNGGRMLGTLTASDIQSVLENLRTSDAIMPYILKMYGIMEG